MKTNSKWRQLFGHHWLIALTLGLATFGVSMGCSFLRWPTPSIHDEFSYLLAADTWNEGRLTNPTHLHWQHFETFHVIQQPSYASKYPPGQGLLLALGQWLTNQPIVGIWILSAFAAAASYWMLLGWMTPRWAVAGSLLFILHPSYQLAWGQSFWGGTLAFLGGALVFGAVARIRTRLQVRDALAMSTGTLLLAISRPYEGSVFCLIIAVVVIASWYRRGLPTTWQGFMLKAVLPQALVLLAGGVCLAYHNQALTGNWRTMPYQIHESTYALSPCFLWKDPIEGREYRHEVMAQFHNGWEMESYNEQHTLAGFLSTKAKLFCFSWNYFFTLPMVFLLLFVPFCHARDKWTVLAVASVAWLPSSVTVWNFPHYLAPMAPVLLVLVVMGLRQAKVFGKRTLNQPRLAPLFFAGQVAIFALVLITYSQQPQDGWQWRRAAIQRQLEKLPDQHLVLVHYAADHNPHNEWVYNRANIDGAKVVWARSMTPAKDAQLLDYFRERTVWHLEADNEQSELVAEKIGIPAGIPEKYLLTKKTNH